MNLLENYLVKIHEIKDYKEDWTKEEWAKDKEYIQVTATFNCYGAIEKRTSVYSKEEWQEIVTKGYYMG